MIFKDSVIASVLIWIEKNLDRSLKLDEVASYAGYSQWYLQRFFKQGVGMTLGEYIRHRRLDESAAMLLNSNVKIITVSEIYGFDSPQSYARAFKKHFHITPSEFRREKTA